MRLRLVVPVNGNSQLDGMEAGTEVLPLNPTDAFKLVMLALLNGNLPWDKPFVVWPIRRMVDGMYTIVDGWAVEQFHEKPSLSVVEGGQS